MLDFNPNEMDALFREGAERHEFEYNSDAWILMEEKLDKKESKRRVLFYLLGLALLVGAILTFSYVHFNKNIKKEKEVVAITSVEKKTEKKQDGLKSIEKDEIITPSKNTAISKIQPEIKEEYISTDSKESSSNIGAQNSFQSENTGNLIGNEIVSIDSHTESLPTEQNQSNVVIPGTTELDITTNLKSNQAQTKNALLSIPALGNKDFTMFEASRADLESFDLNPSHAVIPTLLTLSNRFAATIFANPEWSSVGLFQESKAGWSVGAKVGYQFADRFEVSAGVALSRKIYKGAGTEYNMEDGWFNDVEPMQMDAKCDVIEIPLTLAYYMNGYRNSGFFADLGISSYMLHSEWYGFEYEPLTVEPGSIIEITEEDANSHLVGVGRFAIGYQKVLSNKASLQIAPYLQFPLTGIGAGQVNLYSSGVQIAVKFNTQ